MPVIMKYNVDVLIHNGGTKSLETKDMNDVLNFINKLVKNITMLIQLLIGEF